MNEYQFKIKFRYSEMAQNFEKKSHNFLDVKFDWEMFFRLCGLLRISEL